MLLVRGNDPHSGKNIMMDAYEVRILNMLIRWPYFLLNAINNGKKLVLLGYRRASQIHNHFLEFTLIIMDKFLCNSSV